MVVRLAFPVNGPRVIISANCTSQADQSFSRTYPKICAAASSSVARVVFEGEGIGDEDANFDFEI